jgi:hypothetical protein
VEGKAVRNGSPVLAEAENITARVELRYRSTRASWGRDSVLLEAIYTLRNTSTERLAGPFHWRILSLESELGPVRMVDESGSPVAGNMVRLGETAIAPGATTGPLRLRFVVAPIDSALADAGGGTVPAISPTDSPGIVSFDSKLFAPRRDKR